MPKDFPDWGQFPDFTAATVYEISGENPVRLGGQPRLFRDGLVCYAIDFRDGFRNWDLTANQGTSPTTLVAATSPWSAYCAQLQAGPNLNDEASMFLQIPYPPTSALGFSVLWKPPTTGFRLRVKASVYTESWLYYAGFSLEALANLFLRSGANTFAQLVPGLFRGMDSSNLWSLVKVVVDLTNTRYVSVQTTNELVTPTAPALARAPATPQPRIELGITLTDTDGAGPYTANIGAVIVTYDEPIGP